MFGAGVQPSEESYLASLSARPTPTKEYPRCFGNLVGTTPLAALRPPHSRNYFLFTKTKGRLVHQKAIVRHRILAQGNFDLDEKWFTLQNSFLLGTPLILSFCPCTGIGWWKSKRQG